MSSATSDAPVWLITGCSSGLGQALARRVVDKGWRLVATARDKARVLGLAQGAEDRVLALDLDVVKLDQVEAAVAAAQARCGRVDVLVNNAGYGYQSTAEEGIESEIRSQFDANVFGLFAVTRAVLPIMRAQRSGRIINITSVAGLIGFPGSGYYAASKHAVEGRSDALRAEVEPLGIGVSCVEPGPFRTDWASGSQAGDPERAADIMIALSEMALPPRHLPLGAWGFDVVLTDRRKRLEQLEQVRALSLAADFPD